VTSFNEACASYNAANLANNITRTKLGSGERFDIHVIVAQIH